MSVIFNVPQTLIVWFRYV